MPQLMHFRSQGQSGSHAPPPPPDGEYGAISLGSAWGVVSLILFATSLATRQLIAFLPPRLQGYYLMPPLVVRLAPALALVGLLIGIIGLRREGRRSLALLGVGLNAIVVLLSSFFLIGFWWARTH